MKILVVNAGSSSLKYQLFDMTTNEVLAKGNCGESELTALSPTSVPVRRTTPQTHPLEITRQPSSSFLSSSATVSLALSHLPTRSAQ